ncbi:tumor necrosis factor b (TNF superfamily, member 2) [Tachysurus fulvidraco]|uniref:tumor necrosis factor b (TNF superfamily, member 2) n=1 Tax=Tachysurus fulvidraco TaxID=1234273 RepID=UPI000F51596F|nr:tumor necrosis factor b (TNF superfamily, member 2) [Tachysurus fulvidraco]
MENYKETAADIEASMGQVYQPTVEAVKPSRSWIWTIVGVVVFLSLAAVASFCFAWHFMNKHQVEPIMDQQSATSADTPRHQKLLTEFAKSTKAAIHLHASGHKKSSPQWVSGVDQSFTKGGLKLENNNILIPHDGLYFVYSQASFNLICDEDNERNHLSYSIRWSSHTSPSKNKRYLLSGVKTVCQTKTGEQRNVYDYIYLGAVFQLYEGDELSTETKHLNNIDEHSSKTYFGVFEL